MILEVMNEKSHALEMSRERDFHYEREFGGLSWRTSSGREGLFRSPRCVSLFLAPA